MLGTLFVGNSGGNATCDGPVTSSGHNAGTGTTCGTSQPTDLPSATVTLDGSGDPIAGSVTIDAGGTGCTGMTDVAGFGRPRGTACEIGAKEHVVPFTVNAANDAVDANLTDGRCATSGSVCTLRAAVQQANASAGADTIDVPNGSYTLTIAGASEAAAVTGDLDLTGIVTINANDSSIVGGSLDRVFEVQPGATATINDAVIGGGVVTNQAGGGILVGGWLDLNRSFVLWNQASGTSAYGGGVFFGTNATGGTITNSRIAGNTAPYGAGLHTKQPISIAWSTITANNATNATGGSGIATMVAGSVNLIGTMITGNVGGNAACEGVLTSSGANSASDLTCGLNQPTDLPGVTVTLDTALNPVPGSVTIDAGGNGCSGTDIDGTVRPQGTACDIGAKESAADTRKVAVLNFGANMAPPSGAFLVPHNLRRAFAGYVTGNPTAGDAAIDALVAAGYPHSASPPVPTDDPPPLSDDLGQWNTFSVFPLMFRLEAVEQPASYVASSRRTTVVNWLRDYTERCSLSYEFHNGIWTDNGTSENHQVIRIGNCLLGTYALRNDAALNAIVDPDRGTWQQWADRMDEWLRERASTGGLAELHYSSYATFTLNVLHNVADLRSTTIPANATEIAELQSLSGLATRFLNLTYHEMAMQFDAASGMLGVGGNRITQTNPDDGSDPILDYNNPRSRRLNQWLHMYGWHSQTGNMLDGTGPASSNYVPLDISKQLAQSDTKTFTSTSTESGQVCRARTGNTCTDTQDPGERHGIVHQTTVNDAYQMGAMTYDTAAVHHLGIIEAIWYGINVTSPTTPDLSNSITVSGVAENKSTPTSFMDYFAVNGALQGDVLIAARDKKATNWWKMSGTGNDNVSTQLGKSRGIRVYFGRGDLRNNLVQDSGWYFSKVTGPGGADVAYSAVRFGGDNPQVFLDANGKIRELRMADDDTGSPCEVGPIVNCCNAASDAYDCWAPVVVQMGRAGVGSGTYASFTAFQNAVKAQAYSYTGGVLTYTGLNGDQVQMSRQETTASLPKVKPSGSPSLQDVVVNPTKTYTSTVPGGSSYLEMTYPTAVGVYGSATLRGPTGTAVTLNFDS